MQRTGKMLDQEMTYDVRSRKVLLYTERYLINNIDRYSLVDYPDMFNSNDLKKIYSYFEDKYLVKFVY